uniref:Uncharacterized protein n=1 Tax=Knipowitschia caucasica TaxID=637954 RepID=A0AAV2KB17_KNICA
MFPSELSFVSSSSGISTSSISPIRHSLSCLSPLLPNQYSHPDLPILATDPSLDHPSIIPSRRLKSSHIHSSSPLSSRTILLPTRHPSSISPLSPPPTRNSHSPNPSRSLLHIRARPSLCVHESLSLSSLSPAITSHPILRISSRQIPPILLSDLPLQLSSTDLHLSLSIPSKTASKEIKTSPRLYRLQISSRAS